MTRNILFLVITKARVGTDHVPLILNCGIHEQKKPKSFRFEKWWLEQPDFKELVEKTWNTDYVFTDPMDIWLFNIRLLKKKVKGCTSTENLNGGGSV